MRVQALSMEGFPMPDRRAFVTQLAAGAALLPAALRSRGYAQDPVLDTIPGRTAPGHRELVPWRPEPFRNHQVALRPGLVLTARNHNQAYLHLLPNDRLAHMFRITAGLPSHAEPLGGWEAPKVELRGHLSGGHYLSACALMYAATGDESLKRKAYGLVDDLAACQKAHGNGYLSAFPVSFFDRLREGKPVWAPFYTLHKILAGHLDMYVHCGNEQALKTAEGLAGWVGRWTQPLSYDLMQRILLTEYGGMNEVMYNLYAVTGKEEYVAIARRFETASFFDPLQAHRDELKGLHANTHIPQVIGAARGYELTREPRYYNIADYFWHEITGERAYATGGTSNNEYWQHDPGHMAVGPASEECCCGYNMLKLTRHIFGWSGDPAAMDYYERTLFNSRLGTQEEHGLKQYYVALRPGLFRTFNTPFDSFWCCTGTGMEEFSKMNDTIYFHDQHGVYVNLFIASELNAPEMNLRLRQDTSFPEQQGTALTVVAAPREELALNLRVPYWAQGGGLKLNGQPLPVFSNPSSYVSLRRRWRNGDRVEMDLPMQLHAETLHGNPELVAMMYGPVCLAGDFGTAGITQKMRYGNSGPWARPAKVPTLQLDHPDQTNWVEAASGGPLRFQLAGQSQTVPLRPFYQVRDSHFAVYWPAHYKPRRWRGRQA